MHRSINKFSLKYQLISFGWAFKGLVICFRQEVKPKIHTLAAIMAIALSAYLKIETWEWLWVALSIAFVSFAEIVNTAIEEIANTLPDKHDAIRGKAKDIAAGAVLFASFFAVVVACIIFLPKLWALWQN